MSAKKVQAIVFATKNTWKDNEGNERRTYTRIGTLFTNDEGKQSIELDFVPSDINSGYINIQELKPKK